MKFISCLLLFGFALSETFYRDYIPNGYNVPSHSAVGHTSADDGTERNVNAFGRDFKTARLVWTKEFCQKDSDGDGRSNGVELGDPNCTWKRGDPAPKTLCSEGITDPSVANKFTSTSCSSSTSTGNTSTGTGTTTGNTGTTTPDKTTTTGTNTNDEDDSANYINKSTFILVVCSLLLLINTL